LPRMAHVGHDKQADVLIMDRCAVFRLPHCFDSIHDSVKRVEASVMRGFQQRKSAQVTALLMGTHRR